MSVSQLSQLAPLATVLPSPPDDEVLSAEQWTTLMAVAETVIPEVRPSPTSKIPDGPQMYLSDEEYRATVAEMKSSVQNAPENTVLESYLSESPANSEEFRREFQRTLACHIREDARKGIALVLSTLKSVTHHSGFLRPPHPRTLLMNGQPVLEWALYCLMGRLPHFISIPTLFVLHSSNLGRLLTFLRSASSLPRFAFSSSRPGSVPHPLLALSCPFPVLPSTDPLERVIPTISSHLLSPRLRPS